MTGINIVFTTKWNELRKELLKHYKKAFNEVDLGSIINGENLFDNWYLSFENELIESLNQYQVSEYSFKQLLWEAQSDIWMLIRIAKSVIKEKFTLYINSANKEIGIAALTNIIKQSLDKAKGIYLDKMGVPKQNILNLNNWYKIYKYVKEVDEYFNSLIEQVDDRFIAELAKRLKENKAYKGAQEKSRLKDILYEFQLSDDQKFNDFDDSTHEEEKSGELQLTDISYSDLDYIDGLDTHLFRLKDCFSKLEKFSNEQYQIVYETYFGNHANPTKISKALGISNTKYKNQYSKGLKTLQNCLEHQSRQVLA